MEKRVEELKTQGWVVLAWQSKEVTLMRDDWDKKLEETPDGYNEYERDWTGEWVLFDIID